MYLFQPELRVEAADSGPIFQSGLQSPQSPQTQQGQRARKAEDQAMAMLYRHHVSFAMGHGISVHAETPADDPTCALRLTTSFVPHYDVPATEAPTLDELPALNGLCLDMRTLAEADSTARAAARRKVRRGRSDRLMCCWQPA
ncbi:MAG TPA: hypothetical protein VHZ51_21985 [Ktedonobacteraceae bacterium]|jgi:hypothetical protein|nr:hypothetical protein [Ktedonobacteraceae bacterium]